MSRLIIPTSLPIRPTMPTPPTGSGFAPIVATRPAIEALAAASQAGNPGATVNYSDLAPTPESQSEAAARAFALGQAIPGPAFNSTGSKWLVIDRPGTLTIDRQMLESVDGLMLTVQQFARFRSADSYLVTFSASEITIADEPTATTEAGIRWQKWAEGKDAGLAQVVQRQALAAGGVL